MVDNAAIISATCSDFPVCSTVDAISSRKFHIHSNVPACDAAVIAQGLAWMKSGSRLWRNCGLESLQRIALRNVTLARHSLALTAGTEIPNFRARSRTEQSL